MATSYSNPGGTGNRTSLITVTSNKTPSTGTFSNWVDGGLTADANDAFRITTFTPTGSDYIRFDFGHPVWINEAISRQSNSTVMGTWQWQGSHDGSSWTNIGSSFTLGGATALTHTQLAGNTVFYRYYQIVGVGGSFSGTPYNLDIEFKLQSFPTSISFSDESAVKVGLGFLVDPDVIAFTTPGADTFTLLPYEQLIIEVWGAGASGAAWVDGTPTASDLGADGGNTTLTIPTPARAVTAGGGQRADFNIGGGETQIKIYNPGGEGGVATGGDENINGQKGEDGRRRVGSIGSEFGAYGGSAPLGGAGGPRGAGVSVGYGGYYAIGENASAPGGGGGGAGVGGQAGPPLGGDFKYNRSLGGGGAGGYSKIVYNYMDDGAPEPGTLISFNIGTGGAGPTGDGSPTLDGGDGANGEVRITIGFTPAPPPPDGGQGTVAIDGDDFRVGSFLDAVYANDDPDGGETALAYQWRRDGAPITGATGETYQIVKADVGADIDVLLTYTDAEGYRETVTSDAVGPVLPEARPLDDLLTGLFAAYSPRLLVSSYTGPLVRLRGGSSTNAAHGFQQAGTPANAGNYIRFDFGTPRLITGYTFPQNTYTATVGNGVFQWQGSNDASSWTNIGSNFTFNATNAASADETQLNGNTTPYRYYQLLGISGTLPNNLIWEAEFKIDDNGETSRIGLPGGQSFQNPGGEGNRASMITVTTSYADGNTEAQRLVNGRYPDAHRSFWPDYDTGELDPAELNAFFADVSPISSDSQFRAVYDQSGNGHHLENILSVGSLPVIWNSSQVYQTVPNGRMAFGSNSNRHFRRDSMTSPQNALYFLEVIKRDNDRPIRDWNWGYGSPKAFTHPVSTANDWIEDNAVLHGNGINSGNPRAVTSATFPISDSDAVVWEGGMNSSRIGIRFNGVQQELSVNTPGYSNEAGSALFMWPFAEANTDRSVRLCELVFWERDVGYLDAAALSLYRLDAMLTWMDELPDPVLTAVFEDDSILYATFEVPEPDPEGPDLAVTFYDEAFMSAIVEGIDFSFSITFSDESTISAVSPIEVLPPKVQTYIVVLGW